MLGYLSDLLEALWWEIQKRVSQQTEALIAWFTDVGDIYLNNDWSHFLFCLFFI